MSIKRKLTAIFIAINLITLGAQQSTAKNKDGALNVMTYNMYLGSDFQDIFDADSEMEVVLEVGEAYRDMLAGDVPGRIAAIADQIEAGAPVLVGLQEVALWQTGTFGDPAPATDVTHDFLKILLHELSARGLSYAPIEVQTSMDVEFPGIVTPTTYLDIRYTDRVVILARTDFAASQLKIDGTQSENFAARLPVTVLGQTFTVLRSWASADVKFQGKAYRFINAHLESFYEPIQMLQASELLSGPSATNLPVILVGDFNSDAEASGASYLMLTGGGFTDVWDVQHPNDRGFTWPLSGEIPLPTEEPSQRLDLILARGDISLTNADLLGEEIADLTPSGFRPSDHAGLSATVVLQP